MGTDVAKRLFTTDEYHKMAEAGILHEDDRVELIDGEIIQMSAIGYRHIVCVIAQPRSSLKRSDVELLLVLKILYGSAIGRSPSRILWSSNRALISTRARSQLLKMCCSWLKLPTRRYRWT